MAIHDAVASRRPQVTDPSEPIEPTELSRTDVVVVSVPRSLAQDEMKRVRKMFQMLLDDMPWPGFGEITVLFVAGKPHKIKRTDTVVIE